MMVYKDCSFREYIVIKGFKQDWSFRFVFKCYLSAIGVADKYLMIELDDERVESIAEAISNRTSKKILVLLAESELSESELSEKLGMPLSTIDYNVKKLVRAGLIEKTRTFWSSKGRKIPVYRTSSRKIIISPRKKFSGIVPTILISGVVALALKVFADYKRLGAVTMEKAGETAAAAAGTVGAGADFVKPSGFFYNVLAGAPNSWAWFFIGALAGLTIYTLWNYTRKR